MKKWSGLDFYFVFDLLVFGEGGIVYVYNDFIQYKKN